jgi:DNA-binding transcriptional ArsR family regulator
MSEGQLGEETYSLIFMSLRHPIRRRILRMLADHSSSFSEILEVISVDSGHLSYHLESLGELIRKPQDGKYELSSIGVAAVKLMSGVEEHQSLSPSRESRTRLTTMNIYPLILVAALIAASLLFVSFTVPLRAESRSTSPGTVIHVRPGETFVFNVTIVYTAGVEYAVLTNDSLYHERPPPIRTVTVWEEGAFWFDLSSNETYSMAVTVFHPDGRNVTGVEYNVISGAPIGGLVVFRLDRGDVMRSEYDSVSGTPVSGLGLTSLSQSGEYILEIRNIGLQDLQGLLAFHERWQFSERPWLYYGILCFLLALPYPAWIVFLVFRKPRV